MLIERSAGMFTELSMQQMALRWDQVTLFFNHYYASAHFWTISIALIGAYVAHPQAYRWLRMVLVSVTAIALMIHVVYPLAPPRMFGELGFVDTLERYGPAIYSNPSVAANANQFAAMPSLHFGYAAIVALAIIVWSRSRWRWLAALHPALTLIAIVVTANHFWLDAAVGALIVAPVVILVPVSRSDEGGVATPFRSPISGDTDGGSPATICEWPGRSSHAPQSPHGSSSPPRTRRRFSAISSTATGSRS